MLSKAFVKSTKHNVMYNGCWCSLSFCINILRFVIWSRLPHPLLNSACSSFISDLVFSLILSNTIFNIILLACATSAMVRWFLHCPSSHFFGIGTNIEFIQSSGHSPFSHKAVHIQCILQTVVSPAYLTFRLPSYFLLHWLPKGGGYHHPLDLVLGSRYCIV